MKHINKLAKRFLAFAMIVIMLGGMVPGSAFAQEQPAAEESITGLSAYLEWTAVEEQKNGSDAEPAPAPEDAEGLALGTGEAEKREIGVVEGEDDGLTEYVYQVHVMLTENGAEREVVYQQNEDGLYPYNVDWGNAAQGEANGNTFRTAGAVTASVSYDGVYLSVTANASGVSGITEKTTAALREDVGQTTLYLPAEGSAETAEPFELQGCFGAKVTGGMTVDAPSDDSITVDGTKVTPQKVTGNAASVVVRIKGASGRVYAKQTYSFMVQEKSAIMLSGTMGENGWYRSPVTATVTYEKKGEETVPNAVVTNTDTNAESECPLVSEDGATYTAVLRFGSSADASEGGTPASGKASFSDGEYTIAFSGAKNATLKVDTLAPEMQENSFSVSCKGKETTATICLRDALSGLATVEAAFSADGESWEAAEAATSTDQSENQASDAYTTYSVTADQAYPYVRFTVKDQAGNEVTFDNVDRPAMSCDLVYPSTWEKKTGDPIYFDQEQKLEVVVSNAEGFDASNSYVTIDGTNYFCWNTDSTAKTAAMTICLSDKDETEGAVKLGSLRTISLHAVAASGSLDQVLRGENEPTAIVDTKNPTLTLFAAYGDNVACDVITRGENVYVVVDPVADAPDAEKPTETKITVVGTISDEHFKAPENWFADSKVDVQWKAEEKTFTYSQTVQAGETVELRLPDCVFEDLAGRKLESAVILGKADESGLQSSQMLAVDETTGKLTGKVYVGCVGSDKPDQDQSAPTIGITDDTENKFKTIDNVPVYNTVGEIKFMVDVKDDASGLASVEYWCDGEEHKTLELDDLVITRSVPEDTECDRRLHVRATDNAGNSREVVKSFAIDTWAPRITVTAVSAQPANEVGDVLYYQNGVTYTVSIEDKYLDTHKISATVNDNELEETTIKLMNDGDKLTRLTAEATDRLGHKANWDKLAGKTVVVDRTNPNAEVSFTKDKKTGTLTVTVQATDANLDLEKSYVSFNDGEREKLNNDGTCTFTMQNGDSLTAMTLCVLDKAGRKPDKIEITGAEKDVTGGNELSFEQTENGWKLRGSFQNDQTRPTVSIDVKCENGTENTVGKSVYTNGKAVVTVAVDDNNLDAASSEITYRLNDAKELTRIPLSDVQNGKYILSLEEDAKLSELTVHAEDRYGNPTDKNEDKTIIVDKTAPVVKYTITSVDNTSVGTKNDRKYLSLTKEARETATEQDGVKQAAVTIEVKIEDANLLEGKNGNENYGVWWNNSTDGKIGNTTSPNLILIKTITVKENCAVKADFSLHIEDLAGNPAEAVLNSSDALTLTKTDNGNNFELKNVFIAWKLDDYTGDYGFPTVEITNIKNDDLFGQNTEIQPIITVKSAAGIQSVTAKSPKVKRVSPDGEASLDALALNENKGDYPTSAEYKPQQSLKDMAGLEDNNVSYTVTVTDQSGVSTEKTVNFKVDTCAPRVTVEYNNNEVQNGKYFQAGRTATITVEDANFDPANSTVTADNGKVGTWTKESGQTNTYEMTVTFSVNDNETAECKLALHCVDLAGNVSEVDDTGTIKGKVTAGANAIAPWDFIIDKEKPVVTVSLSTTGKKVSTNNGTDFYNNTVTVTIKAEDKYIKEACSYEIQFNETESVELKLNENETALIGSFELNGLGATQDDPNPTTHGDILEALSVKFHDPAGNPAKIEGTLSEGGEWKAVEDGFRYNGNKIEVDDTAPKIEIKDPTGKLEIGKTNYVTSLGEDQAVLAVIVHDVNYDENNSVLTYEITDCSGKSVKQKITAETTDDDGVYEYKIVLKDGERFDGIEVVAKDFAGNEKKESKDYDVIFDATAPEVEIEITAQDDEEQPVPVGFYTRKDSEDVVFVTLNENGVTSDGKELHGKPVTVTVTVTVTDGNITEETVKASGKWKKQANTKINSADNEITFTMNNTIKPNETETFEIDLSVADEAGNKPNGSITVNGENGTTFKVDVKKNGEIKKTVTVDRKPATSGEDKTPPQIVLNPTPTATGKIAGNIDLFSDVDEVKFTMTVSDASKTEIDIGHAEKVSSGLKRISWSITDEAKAVEDKAKNLDCDGEFTKQESLTASFERNAEVKETNSITIWVEVEDNSGNVTTYERKIAMDNCAPRVNVSYNPETSQRGNEYFNQTRTVAVTVTDLNYETASLSINGEERELKPVEDGVSGSMEYTFAADGTYDVAVKASDKVQHQIVANAQTPANTLVTVSGAAPWHFVIDRTAPVITVSYDNNSSRNGRYYKASRNARISIQETNYDAGNTRGTITATLDGQQISAPALNLAAQNTSVNFSADGDYAMKIDCEDLAGNRATYTGEPFTIDQTAPEVEINVKEYSANTGSITPEITMTDINFDRRGWSAPMQVLSGLNATAKTADWSNSNSTIRHGVRVSYVNLQKSKQNDGVYILTAKVTDLAGNDTTKTVTFSVNRFGSTYVAYDTATQKLLDVGYGKTAPTIKIQEINPNEIRNEKVVLSTGSESVTLKKGTDYTVEATTGKDCWNGALYSVKASVFEKNGKLAEGSYELTFFSEDSANHSNSNRANEAGLPVRFTLDTSAPVVVITGVDNGDRIRAASRDVTLFYSDSSGIKEIIIYLDGKEYLRLSAEELAKHPDSYTFTVDQSNSGRVLSVKVLDAADNEVKTDDIRFFLNSSVFQQYLHNAVLLAITGAVLALAIVLAILLIRRKKRAAHASNT